MVVDPVDDVEVYVRAAADTGMRIRYVVDTHVHADHISGRRRLASRAGGDYVLHASAAGPGTTAVPDGAAPSEQ